MAVMLPSELDFALDLLGYEWPNINEDVVREAAELVRTLETDLQGTLDALDRTIENDLSEAFHSRAASAYLQAYTDNRTQNMDRMLDLLPGVADGVDAFALVIEGLKTKVVIEVGITAAQIAAAAASAVFTAGASLAANAAIIAARKKVLDIATELAMEQVIAQVATMVIEPLTTTAAGLAEAVLDAPVTTAVGGEVPTFDISYAAMDALADAIQDCGDDQADIIDTFVSRFTSLPYFEG